MLLRSKLPSNIKSLEYRYPALAGISDLGIRRQRIAEAFLCCVSRLSRLAQDSWGKGSQLIMKSHNYSLEMGILLVVLYVKNYGN